MTTRVVVMPDDARDEPGATYGDVLAYVVVTSDGFLHQRMVSDLDPLALAQGLRDAARRLEHYAATGVWAVAP